MRKYILFFLTLLFLSPLCAQTAKSTKKSKSAVKTTAVEKKTEVPAENMQYENFAWEPVPNAKKYQVNLEKRNAEGNWEVIPTEKIKECSIEILLAAGKYRASVSTFNVLGKRASTSEWTRFTILDEKFPYLFPNVYNKNAEYQIPVLKIQRRKASSEKSGIYIKAPQGYGDSALLIHGKNIFSPNTKLYLVPAEADEQEQSFRNYLSKRKKVNLKIEKRDARNSKLYVTYNADLLQSGYYNIEAVNYGEYKADYKILVLVDEDIQLQLDSGFKKDDYFRTEYLSVKDNQSTDFSVKGSGFSNRVDFSLQPAQGEIPYIFKTLYNKKPVSLEVKNISQIGDNYEQKAELTVPAASTKPGYYKVSAIDADGAKQDSLILVKTELSKSNKIDVKKISSKYNKKTGTVDFTLKGSNLDPLYKYSLSLSYSKLVLPETEQLLLVKNNDELTKITVHGNPENITFGKCILTVETPEEMFGYYLDLNKSYKTKMFLTESEPEEFLYDNSDDNEIEENDERGVVSLRAQDTKVVAKAPKVLPYARITGTVGKNTDDSSLGTDLRLELDALNLGWINFPVGIKVDPRFNFDETERSEQNYYPDVALELNAWLTAQFKYFSPYIGLGLGYDILSDIDGFTNWKNHDLYAGVQSGFNLFDFFEVKFNYMLHEILSGFDVKNFSPEVGFGIRIPLRPIIYDRQTISQALVIQKQGTITGADYPEINKKKINALEFKSASIVEGFENSKGIKNLYIPSGVQIIEENAFKNNTDLISVDFTGAPTVRVIKSGAFAEDTKIKEITIPASVEKIEAGAFENWTDNQVIYLRWTEEYFNTYCKKEDFAGLHNIQAQIFFSDGCRFNKVNYRNPVEDIRNWNDMKNFTYKSKIVTYEGERYSGITITGTAYPDPGLAIYGEYSHVEDELKAYLYNNFKNSTTFKVQGDGNRYNLIISIWNDVTQEWTGYYKQFNTIKDKVTEVTIRKEDFHIDGAINKNFEFFNTVSYQIVPETAKISSQRTLNATFFDFTFE